MTQTVESPAKDWENEEDVLERKESGQEKQDKKRKKWRLPFSGRKEPLTKEQKKKRRRRMLLGGLALAVAALLLLPRLAGGEQLPVVEVARACRGKVSQTITGSGLVCSEQEITYFSPVGATVERCSLAVGDTVEKGDVLLTYDAAELDALWQQAALTGEAGTYGYQDAITRDNKNISEYNRSTHDIGILEQQVKDQEGAVEHLTDRVAEYTGKQAESAQTLAAKQEILANVQQGQIAAQQELEKAQQELQEAGGDPGKQSAAKEKVDKASEALATLDAQAEAAEKDVKTEQDYLNEVTGKLSDYQNRLNDAGKELADFNENLAKQESIQSSSDAARLTGAARSQLAANENLSSLSTAQTKEQIEKGRRGIIAEFSGVVTSVEAAEGGPAAQGQALLTVASNEAVSVEMNITRYDLEKLEEGQTAAISLAGREYSGTVTKLSHLAQQNEKGTPVVKAQVQFDNPDGNVYLGMEANVTVRGREKADVLTVPAEAVNTGRDGSFCYIVRDGVVEKRAVETGISSDTLTEIVSGLQENDLVIRRGMEAAEEGMRVLTREEDGSSLETADS